VNAVRQRFALWAALAVLAWVAPAGAQTTGAQTTVAERFTEATAAIAAGEHERAAAAFLTLVGDAPDHALASDALFTAAKLYEERLMDPARALPLYRRIVQEYPDSRPALAAERRAEEIAKMLQPAAKELGGGPGIEPDNGADVGLTGEPIGDGAGGMAGAAQALARFTDILQGYTERGESESLALAEKLLLEHPDWRGAARVWAWSASVHERAGRWPQALSHYRRAINAVKAAPAASDEVLFTAYRGAGDAELALGRLAAAERYYRLLPARGDTSRALSQADALQALAQARWRRHWYDMALVVLALVVVSLLLSLRLSAGSAAMAWQIVRRPPTEVIFMMPIAAVLIAASLTAHYAIFPAVSIICLGGMAIAWLSGAALTAAAVTGTRRRRLRALLHALAAVIAVIALCYIAIHRNRLIDLILDTVRFGPEL
jgi:tetratricopeptide (TPR) repeat protein